MAVSKLEQKKFYNEVLRIRKEHGGSMIEAIVKYAEIRGVDVVAITKYISSSLKTKIAAEARGMNLLKTKKKK